MYNIMKTQVTKVSICEHMSQETKKGLNVIRDGSSDLQTCHSCNSVLQRLQRSAPPGSKGNPPEYVQLRKQATKTQNRLDQKPLHLISSRNPTY